MAPGSVARPAAKIGGVLGEATGGFAGGFGHGFKHGLAIGAERYNTGGLGRAVTSGIEGYSKGRVAIEAKEEPKAIEAAPADRAEAPQRRVRLDPYAIHDLGRAGPSEGKGQVSGPEEARPATVVPRLKGIGAPAASGPRSGGGAPMGGGGAPRSGGALVPSDRSGALQRQSAAYAQRTQRIHAVVTDLPRRPAQPMGSTPAIGAGPPGQQVSRSVVPYAANTSSSAGAASTWRLPTGTVMPYSSATSKSTFHPTLF